jgi:hypothetical protein
MGSAAANALMSAALEASVSVIESTGEDFGAREFRLVALAGAVSAVDSSGSRPGNRVWRLEGTKQMIGEKDLIESRLES